MQLFVDKDPGLDTSWRSIILLGRNVASYKFALAKSLLEIDTSNSEIEIENLAVPFAKNICDHLNLIPVKTTLKISPVFSC